MSAEEGSVLVESTAEPAGGSAVSVATINADARIMFEYPDYLTGLTTALITLPTMSNPASAYWIGCDTRKSPTAARLAHNPRSIARSAPSENF